MANRLINETSPYLLQHAHNPVDWYPWGEEAFRHAKEKNKPIFLSIGYSSCHWCHVMERESFENDQIAGLMNELFISIKVDREERPDLDQIYMAAVQILTGRGGWPLNVFITPEGKPFYGGTYFPPEDSAGMAGFPRVLRSIAAAYHTKPDELARAVSQLQSQLQNHQVPRPGNEPLTGDILDTAFGHLQKGFDYANGGFGAAPKFPQPMALEFLLHYYLRSHSPQVLQMVETSLTNMARGGIFDQLGGGFHRYSTDANWLVPHFEKMLYDNALLSRLYLHAYQATGKPFYRHIAEETLDYVAREMTSPEGGFYSAQDADSEGVEGKYYVWKLEEIVTLLGKYEARILNRYFGVTDEGNFDGANILFRAENPESLAIEIGLTPGEIEGSIQRSKKLLLEVRERRVKPARDEKVLAAWNGLMMTAFAEAANILDRQDYRQIARTNAIFLLGAMREGRWLLRSYKDGKAKIPGYLEDYAAMIDGLLALHSATFEPGWLVEARQLADTMVEEFWDGSEKVFYDTGRRHEMLFLRPRDIFDNVIPSGSSNAARVLLHMAAITGNRDYARPAITMLRSMRNMMLEYPSGMANWLCALDFNFSTPVEIAIIGTRDDAGTQALVSVIYNKFIPNKIVVGRDTTLLAQTEGIPLLEQRNMVDGRPTAYVCENYSCLQPATDTEELRRQLEGQTP
ncbi:MAG: thioredoxin domain-containing protein [Dehalococcoidia bacterium]|nr:thioredoxin domain-containing protein [Dehalococcoidia bacterium]